MKLHSFAAFAVLSVVAGANAQSVINIGFEDYNVGTLQGANGAYTGGSYATHVGSFADKWWSPGNAVVEDSVVNGIAKTGNQSLEISRLGNGFDGVVNGIKTPVLGITAGETGSPVNATVNQFQFSYWIRTAPTSVVSGFTTTMTSWGADRTTWLGLEEDGGSLKMLASGLDANGNWDDQYLSQNLQWGAWYKVVGNVNFVNGGAANDVFNVSLFDSSNALVGSATTYTWEYGQRNFGWNGGTPVAVDGLGFNTRFSSFVGAHAYVDDITFAAVPEPGTMAAIGLGVAALIRRRRKSA